MASSIHVDLPKHNQPSNAFECAEMYGCHSLSSKKLSTFSAEGWVRECVQLLQKSQTTSYPDPVVIRMFSLLRAEATKEPSDLSAAAAGKHWINSVRSNDRDKAQVGQQGRL